MDGARFDALAALIATARSRRTLLGALAGGAVLSVMGAELTRVWKLGMLPVSREVGATTHAIHPVKR